MNKGLLILLSFLLQLSNCAKPTTDRFDDEAKRLTTRLDGIRKQIAEAEKQAEAARRKAAMENCRAGVAKLQANIELRRAECLNEVARHNQCIATQEREKGDATLLGCLIGFGVAAATGGAATPWALGGCSGGRLTGEATQAGCPPPACAEHLKTLDAEVLAGAGLDHLPFCGGFLGATVRQHWGRRSFGIEVNDVVPRSTSEALGLKRGDVLVSIDKQKLVNPNSLAQFVAARSYGETIRATFARGDQLLISEAEFVPPPGEDPRGTPKLGFRGAPTPRYGVEYRWGVVVENLDRGGPATSAGLRKGDLIIAVGDEEVVHPSEVEGKLRDRAPTDKVAIKVERRKEGYKVIEVVLADRGERKGL